MGINSNFETVIPLSSEVGTVSGGYVKVGKVVIVSAKIKLTQNATSNVTQIFNGLPSAGINYTEINVFNIDGGNSMCGYLLNQTSLRSSLIISKRQILRLPLNLSAAYLRRLL